MRRMPSFIEHSSASSIGPPMMKNMSLTPCAFRHRARISLPDNSVICVSPHLARRVVPALRGVGRTQSAIGTSDHAVIAQAVDIGGADAEPFVQDFGRVLSEQRS